MLLSKGKVLRDLKNALLALIVLIFAPIGGMERVPPSPSEFIASFFYLPRELKHKIIYMSVGEVLNVSELARGICSLAAVNRTWRASINNSMFAILQSLPTNAAGLYLAKKLAHMPGTQSQEVTSWLANLKFESGHALYVKIVLGSETKEISALLSNRNIDLNYRAVFQSTLLMRSMSCFCNKTHEIFKLLLNAGADPNQTDDTGSTALIRVAHVDEKGWEETYFRPLYGSAIERQAAHTKQKELAVLLLKAGANPDTKNNAGKTAYDLALEEENIQVAELLATASAERKTRLAQRAAGKRKI